MLWEGFVKTTGEAKPIYVLGHSVNLGVNFVNVPLTSDIRTCNFRAHSLVRITSKSDYYAKYMLNKSNKIEVNFNDISILNYSRVRCNRDKISHFEPQIYRITF